MPRIAAAAVLLPACLLAQDYPRLREAMVRQQMEARGIRDARVLAAFRQTPRHEFVPPALRPSAYADHPLPIGHDQTISQPYIVALMTELLAVQAGHRVLEIGTGSGYQTAILAQLAGQVHSIEIVEPLAAAARQRLAALGYRNVQVRAGDGYQGWKEAAPFDRIILTAAPPRVPQALLDQLKPGGILVAPVGSQAENQELVVITKDTRGRLQRRAVLPVRFVPMVPGK
jgi:protein-L-isoaspartate(D-aspartate) O-methyltransferase